MNETTLVPSHLEQTRFGATKYTPEFDVQGKVIVVTGGGRGLGLCMAEALFQAGAIVHCLDRLPEPHDDFPTAQKLNGRSIGGRIHYHRIELTNTQELHQLVADIATEHQRLDGLIAAAGVQQVTSALDFQVEDVRKMLDVNYVAVLMSAQAVTTQMLKWNTPGSIMLVASMSAMVANKGLRTCVYNSSKAAVFQLTRNLAMEWGKEGIRVNSLCPGHIVTPMVEKNFEDEPWLREMWENENMLGRLSKPNEFRGAAIFLLSNASSFMTGSSLVIDGGHTAW
ncbi:alcohol dehydrogenase [Exophiala aquamarina CBS 119918]|uniref:Alcohol dehydrogenase n=1 Tax=Exophiala aquamarina CBS 119918 TaxID=1182545 RepID=A0A072P944_9EURO|nr:alcohol dehydrogenase [Exophiala aquamarina CBS 119918]KEF56381.1 alcohol dehydrogenase [Exophiala aquamarina CBS 119918]